MLGGDPRWFDSPESAIHVTSDLLSDFEGGLRISVAVSSLGEAQLGKDLVLRVESRSPATGLHSSSSLCQTMA